MKQQKYRLTCSTLIPLMLITPLTFANTEQMHTSLTRINTLLSQITI